MEGDPAQAVGPVVFLFAGLLLAWYVFRYARRCGAASRLMICHRGVRFDDPELDAGCLDWSRIDRAKYSWMGRLRVIGKDGRKLVSIPVHKIGGAVKASRCAEAINQARAAYQ